MAPVDEHHGYIYERLAEADQEIVKLQEAVIELSKALHDTIKRLKDVELYHAKF